MKPVTCGPIESELRNGPPKHLTLVQWLMAPERLGGMSFEAYRLALIVGFEHGLNYDYPEDAISYAIEAAEALGL